jgi:hypothetical protein
MKTDDDHGQENGDPGFLTPIMHWFALVDRKLPIKSFGLRACIEKCLLPELGSPFVQKKKPPFYGRLL